MPETNQTGTAWTVGRLLEWTTEWFDDLRKITENGFGH